MNRSLRKSEIIGCLFVWIMGTLFHFVYDWTNQNQLVGLFTPINESVWEHLKLLFFPYIFYIIFQYFYVGKQYSSYFTAKLLGILCGMVFVVIGFYLTLAIVGKPVTWIDVMLFFVGVLVSYLVSYQFMIRNDMSDAVEVISFISILTIMILFWGFTYNPPDFSIFQEIKES